MTQPPLKGRRRAAPCSCHGKPRKGRAQRGAEVGSGPAPPRAPEPAGDQGSGSERPASPKSLPQRAAAKSTEHAPPTLGQTQMRGKPSTLPGPRARS